MPPPPPLLRLPDELLLHIANHLLHSSHTYTHLLAVSLTCRRLRAIGQELLVTHPDLDVHKLHMYLYLLRQHTRLIPKIKTLHLWRHPTPPATESLLRAWTRLMRNPDSLPRETQSFCAWLQREMQTVFKGTPIRAALADVANWEHVVDEYVIPALVCVLWGQLKKLTQLKVSGADLYHLRFLASTMVRPLLTHNNNDDDEEQEEEDEEQHRGPGSHRMDAWVGQLEIVEFPEKVAMLGHYTQPARPWSFHNFHALKVLSIPMQMLVVQPFPSSPVPALRRQRRIIALDDNNNNMFPASLQCLRVLNADPNVGAFVHRLCLARRERGRFAHLRRLELYFYSPLAAVRKLTKRYRLRDPWTDYWRLSMSAEMELFVCFADRMKIDVAALGGRTVWFLRDAGELPPAEDTPWALDGYPLRLEGEWDADGDFTMVEAPRLPAWVGLMRGRMGRRGSEVVELGGERVN